MAEASASIDGGEARQARALAAALGALPRDGCGGGAPGPAQQALGGRLVRAGLARHPGGAARRADGGHRRVPAHRQDLQRRGHLRSLRRHRAAHGTAVAARHRRHHLVRLASRRERQPAGDARTGAPARWRGGQPHRPRPHRPRHRLRGHGHRRLALVRLEHLRRGGVRRHPGPLRGSAAGRPGPARPWRPGYARPWRPAAASA